METERLYTDGKYLENNPRWHEDDSPWKAGITFDLLKRNGVHPASVCEVGCGAGGILQALADRLGPGSTFAGYDISPQAYSLCKPKERPGLRFHLENFLETDAPPFDVVMAMDVFEHVPDYWGFLKALRPKGTYKVFHIPLDMSVQTVMRVSPILRCRKEVGHLHYFNKETALATLEDTGYTVLEACITGYSLNLPRRIARAIHPDLAARFLGGFSLLVLAK